MAPRRKQRTKFVWDVERSNFLLHCHELISAKQLPKKQLQVQLRKMFRKKYPECELADSTLYNYALTVKKEKPLPDNSRVSFWDQATDGFLIECVLRAQVENRRAIDQGLMAGKIGKQSCYTTLLMDLFAARYPDVSAGYVRRRVSLLRAQKRIPDDAPPSSTAPTAAEPSVDSNAAAFFRCAMKYWEIGYQFAGQPLFSRACCRCSCILLGRRAVRRPGATTDNNEEEPSVYRYYTERQVSLAVRNARTGQSYYCVLCANIDLLAKYPLTPDTVKCLPLPKCIADLNSDERRSVSLVALHSTTAKDRSDALRIFHHLRGELLARHQDDRRYLNMYAMIVSRTAVATTTTTRPRATKSSSIAQQMPEDPKVIRQALKWLKVNNHLYRTFAANYETLLRYQPRKPGQPTTLKVFGDVDFAPNSKRLTKSSILDKELSGLIVPAFNVPSRGANVRDSVTATQHQRDFRAARQAHADMMRVQLRDRHLEAKLFPWLFPYGLGSWHHEGQRGVTHGAYVKWRILMCADERFRREPDYMFFMLDTLIKERLQYFASCRVHVANLAEPLTKRQVVDASAQHTSNPYEQYGSEIPATVPNSRNYWAAKTLDLIAMSQRMGRQPDLFITLTENDSWPELQSVIRDGLRGVHTPAGRKEMEDVHRFGRPAMGHPVETVEAFYRRLAMFRKRFLQNPSGPIGDVQDFWLRIEYQKRGSLHAHLVVWMEPGSVDRDKLVTAEMPRFVHPMNTTWRHIVESYQLHRCIPERCMKGSFNKKLTRCKYGFRFAVNNTLRPAKTGIRYMYVRREDEDGCVIPYNLPLILMWDGHVNAQLVTPGGWEVYLAKYVGKADAAIKMHITTKRSNECAAYMKGRVVSLLEAATLLEQRSHVMSTREVVYLPVSAQPTHRVLKRQQHMAQLNDDDTNLYYDTKLEKYLDRPQQLSNLTYEQYYEQYYYSVYRQENELILDGSNDDNDDNDDVDKFVDDDDDDPDYVDENQRHHQPQSKQRRQQQHGNVIIIDKHGRRVRKRLGRPAIVRFSHYSPYGKFLEQYCLVKLLRTVPVDRVSFEALKSRTGSYLQECLNRNLIEEEGEARHFLEGAAKQGFSLDRLRDMASRLIDGNWLEDQDVDQLLETVAPYHMDAERVRCGVIVDDDDKETEDIVTDDRHGLDINVRSYLPVQEYVAEFTASQRGAFERITDAWKRDQQVLAFVVGGGGVGKSFLLDSIVAYCNENGRTVQKLATTGCAAHLIGGITIHSYLRMGPDLNSHMERGSTDAYLLQLAQVLLIDEVSMLEERVMEKLEFYLTLFSADNDVGISSNARKTPANPAQRFAGKSIIMFGDPAQLPPIGRHIWQPALLKGFQIMLLRETVRQRNDKRFAELLSRVRLGEPTVEDIDALQSRVVTDAELRQIDVTSRGLILFPMRRQKDAMNDIELAKLPGSMRSYVAEDVDSSNLPVPKNVREYIVHLEAKNTLLPKCLQMKVGARVMLLRNRDVEHGWVNGKIAVVETMSSDYIVVADPTEPRLRLIVHRVRQDIRPPSGNGTFYRRQFPLDLAYGVTIHKSQGQTLDVVAVSAECLNSSGQFYTAISRVRELDALYFMRFDPNTIFLAADIRKLLDWMDIVDVLRDQGPVDDNDVTMIPPPMPEVSQITFRPQWKQPTVNVVKTDDDDVVKTVVKTRPVTTSPAVTRPPSKRKRVNKTPTPTTAVGCDVSIRDALRMVCTIPTDVPLDEYIRQMRTIVARFPTTMPLMEEIAGLPGCTYDGSRPDHTVDQRLSSRFYRAFVEEQAHVICTTGDNSCMFHAFSLLMYGHEHCDELFRWLCCVQFMLQNDYYDDDHNRNHLDYDDSVPLLIHNTALAVQQQSGQRTWGCGAHLKAMSDIARRDVYVYMATRTEATAPHQDCLSLADWQLMVDADATRGALHMRYEPCDPIAAGPPRRRQAITLLLSDVGTHAAHYSAILPFTSRIRMLRPNVLLPPPRHERDELVDLSFDRITIVDDDDDDAAVDDNE